MAEPLRFIAGETLTWTKCLADYKASDGWVLTYYFRGPSQLDAPATADGQNFSVTISSTATANLLPGRYGWQAWVELSGTKVGVDSGIVDVEQALTGDVTDFDTRSKAKQIIDAIDAMVAGTASLLQRRVTVTSGGMERTLESWPITDLIGPNGIRAYYAMVYSREQRLARIRKGRGYFQQVKSRF